MRDPDPWTAILGDFPGTGIHYRNLADRWGQTIWDDSGPRIELAIDLDYVRQRCTLGHEYQHLVAGRPCVSYCDRNEREVLEATARWLLPDLDELGALLSRHDVATVAARLDVTVDVVNDRIVTANTAERERLCGLIGGGTDAPLVRAAHGPRHGTQPKHTCRKKERK